MDKIKQDLENILFNIGKEIKIHQVNKDNTIIEIDYDKYVQEIIDLFNNK